jgi:hypothetical protein
MSTSESRSRTDEILAEIGKGISIKVNLLFAEASAPLIYQRYIGKKAVGGFPLTVRNIKWGRCQFNQWEPQSPFTLGEGSFQILPMSKGKGA